ncbi:type II secretion system F family protein [Radiobacillus deserti]|uniref:Type II secretion system protein GspF domain-containing protein n=1 Tax=Radiobacillus deserti TaxID=2594883 RepID=A0A516KGV6_9BACI|nr:type II secretion system F family protein [Radiobacillus deserti]QDP40596.1 hypothetical protein FN924_10580 [Radiobacillus deserti]
MPLDLSIKHLFLKQNRELNPKTQQLYLDRLVYFLQNGYTLLHALDRMSWDKRLQPLARQSKQLLQEGAAFDYVLQDLGFKQRLYSFIAVTQMNGDLQRSISQCQTLLKNEMGHIRTFKNQIRYPICLLFLFLLVLYAVRSYIYPSFQQLFISASSTSPLLSFSMTIFDVLFTGSLFLVGVIVCFIPIGFQLSKRLPIHQILRIQSLLPIYSRFVKMKNSFYFSLLLSSLLKTGASIKEALTILSKQQDMPFLSYHALQMLGTFKKGDHPPETFSSGLAIEEECLAIFQLDANTRKVEKDLLVYAELLNNRLQSFVSTLLKLIQPIFFSALAIFILFVYLSFMVPMFDLMKNI